jgi:eukaryotic-like serine/threonine-protein kinase
VTQPPDPFASRGLSYDPLGRTPIDPLAEPLAYPEPPEPPGRPPANAFATLSVLFAFVFAPVGALLGHLGLAQIRRTGERGRERALVGVALSYSFIGVTIFALVGWGVVAAVRSTREDAPVVAETTAAPAPTVAAADLGQLLPGLTDVKKITGDQNLTTGKTWDHLAKGDRAGRIDRDECWGSIGAGTPDSYNVEAVFGYRASEFSDTHDPRNSTQVVAGVAAFRDADAAQAQLTKLLSGWHQCGGSDVKVSLPSGQILTFSLGAPADAGNGITTMEVDTKGLRRAVRALAAKDNVVVDLDMSYAASGAPNTDRAKQATSVVKFVLGKIPG